MTTTIVGPAYKFVPQYARSSTVTDAKNPVIAKDRYVRVKSLPTGTQGYVRVVRSSTTQEVFVCKTLGLNLSHEYPAEIRILRNLNAGIRHRNIVHSWHYISHFPASISFLQEFCEGGDLRDQLTYHQEKFDAPMPRIFKAHAFVQLASGLAFIHHGLQHHRWSEWTIDPNHESVVHGDIKPENILLRWGPGTELIGLPDLVIADFGLSDTAREFRHDAGTNGYLPPEVVENEQRKKLKKLIVENPMSKGLSEIDFQRASSTLPITTKADIYTFGLTMKEIICGTNMGSRPINRPAEMFEFGFMRPPERLAEYVRICVRKDAHQRWDFMHGTQGEQDHQTLLHAIDDVRRGRNGLLALAPIPPTDTWRVAPGTVMDQLQRREAQPGDEEMIDIDDEIKEDNASCSSGDSQDDRVCSGYAMSA